jgi:TatD DNase family protein
MLSTRRGREYARVLPADRLLLETDLPPESDSAFALDAWEADIREALAQLESIRGEAMAAQLADTSIQLLNA